MVVHTMEYFPVANTLAVLRITFASRSDSYMELYYHALKKETMKGRNRHPSCRFHLIPGIFGL